MKSFNMGDRVVITQGKGQGLIGHVQAVHQYGTTVAAQAQGLEQRYMYELKLIDGRMIPRIDHAFLQLAPVNEKPIEQEELDKIISRIQRMYAKAESARQLGNEAEAMAFMQGVQKTLMKYKLEMSDVMYVQRNKIDPIETVRTRAEEHGLQVRHARVAWIEQLGAAIARAHHCRTLIYPKSADIAFVGRKTDRQVAEFVFVTVQRFAHQEADKQYSVFYRKMQRDGTVHLAKGYRSDWLRGFVHRVAQRYAAEEAALKRAMASKSTALVRLSTALAEVDEHMDGQKYGKARSAVGKRVRNNAGFRDGVSTADKANLRGTGIGGGSSPSQKPLGAGNKRLPGS